MLLINSIFKEFENLSVEKMTLSTALGFEPFIFAQTYFLIASRKIFKNDAILINHGSFF